MLQELRVNNLALIDSLELDFSGAGAGLIVLTGETGAGKSIILQAIHLLTGGRASPSWVRNESEQAVIEAVFDISSHPELTTLLRKHGLDNEEDCILRRIVRRKGRSSLFINDRSATTRLTGELSEKLINIASQHDHQQLLRSTHHIDFLDSYGDLLEDRNQYSQVYQQWQKLRRELHALQGREQDKEQRRDFLSFQLKEIREIDPQPGEDEALIKERDLLKSSTTLAELAGRSHHLIRNKIVEHLAVIRKDMDQAAALDPNVVELAQRIRSSCFEIEDLEDGLRSYRESIPMDQGRVDAIAERLAQLRQLQRKYGTTLEEVIEFAAKTSEERAALENLEGRITALAQEVQKKETGLRQQADSLSRTRQKVAVQLNRAMETELSSLSFNQAMFQVSITRDGAGEGATLSATGQDRVAFLFSANPGEPPKPLADVVSGGELSRLMLAMKCLLARRDKVDTVIFDEIDAGISGEAAEAVGRKINELAGHHQVFCITHLPQIAAHAEGHYLVEKLVDDNRTRTQIRSLKNEERVGEVARMLGGDNPTEQTMAFARELIERHSA